MKKSPKNSKIPRGRPRGNSRDQQGTPAGPGKRSLSKNVTFRDPIDSQEPSSGEFSSDSQKATKPECLDKEILALVDEYNDVGKSFKI